MHKRSGIMVSMNRLSTAKRGQILALMTEGNSLRATSRLAGVSINTVSKLLVDAGAACTAYQDRVMRELPCAVMEVDEIWAFCYAKQKNVPERFKDDPGYGDVWTFTAIDADTKLAPTWLVGDRTADDADVFLRDLASRLANRIQLSTDGHSMPGLNRSSQHCLRDVNLRVAGYGRRA